MTEVRNMFTTGNAITIGVLVLGGAITWGMFTNQLSQTTVSLAKLESKVAILETSVGQLSIQNARTDEKLINILEYLRRIDNKISAQDLREKETMP